MTEPTSASSGPQTFANFDEFWPYYVGEHLNPVTRWLHFAGTTAAMATLGVAAVTRRPSLVLAAAVMGYGPAWASHFFVEHNRPATFKHPVWSLRGDLVMWKKMIDGSRKRWRRVKLCARARRPKKPPTRRPSRPGGFASRTATRRTTASPAPR
jgi:hypothetical protein